MFVRYTAKYYNHLKNCEETGFFRAADYVRDHAPVEEHEKTRLARLVAWFDAHLPVPEFYDNPAGRTEEMHTYFWFKASAEEFLAAMEAVRELLEKYGVRIEVLRAERVSGELVFEDYCQIAVAARENPSPVR